MTRGLPDAPPVRLRFHRGGPGASNLQLEWEYGQLWFREDPASADGLHRQPWKPFLEPSRSAWERLHHALDRAGFWEGPKHPARPDAGAAGRWRLEVHWGRRSRKAEGVNGLPITFVPVEHALLALPTQELPGIPRAFHLHCEWPGGEEHYGWDGRLLAFASYFPEPRIVEGLQVPAVAWKGILPLLEEVQGSAATEYSRTPFEHHLSCQTHSPRCLELREVLRKLIPADRRG